ncbi:hypothetical protein MGAST_00360 [Mycobacterium gastri 'Wayne']|nr:hypothetical protein MGAST_00360 [Mycobacterium gastri 'Wayne']
MLPISIDAVVGGPADVDGAAVPLLVAVVGFPELLVAAGGLAVELQPTRPPAVAATASVTADADSQDVGT